MTKHLVGPSIPIATADPNHPTAHISAAGNHSAEILSEARLNVRQCTQRTIDIVTQ